MKTMMPLALLVALAAATPAAGQSFAHGWNDAKNEYDAARWRREAEKAGHVAPAGPVTMKAAPGPAGYLPPEAFGPAGQAAEPEAPPRPASDAAPAPKAAPKKALGPADPFAPRLPQFANQARPDGRAAGREAAIQAGAHANRISAHEIERRAKAVAGKARIPADHREAFVRDFLAGFASVLEGRR